MRKAVKAEDILPLIQVWMRLHDKGADEDEILEALAKFWTGRELESFEQAETYVDRLAEFRKAPEEYYGWLDTREKLDAPKSVESASHCPKCGQVLLADNGKCTVCLRDARRHDDAADQKRDWDDRRVVAHRRFGTHVKRCRCGHHLVEGVCELKFCKCQINPGCGGKIPGAR